MRKLIQLFTLFAAPIAAHATALADTATVPEPETLSLLAIGAVAMFLSTRRKK